MIKAKVWSARSKQGWKMKLFCSDWKLCFKMKLHTKLNFQVAEISRSTQVNNWLHIR